MMWNKTFCVKCLHSCWVSRIAKGLKCHPSYSKQVTCHCFLGVGWIHRTAGGETKDVTTQGTASCLSITYPWVPPDLRFHAVVMVILGRLRGTLCRPSVPPWREPSLGNSQRYKGPLTNPPVLCPERRLRFYSGHQETRVLHPRGKYSIFQGCLLYRHSSKDSLE